jgi:hypothetical protein
MLVIERFTAAEIQLRSPPSRDAIAARKRPTPCSCAHLACSRFRYSTKHEPPRWGGYVTLKLGQSSMASGRRGLVAVRISVTTWLGS